MYIHICIFCLFLSASKQNVLISTESTIMFLYSCKSWREYICYLTYGGLRAEANQVTKTQFEDILRFSKLTAINSWNEYFSYTKNSFKAYSPNCLMI